MATKTNKVTYGLSNVYYAVSTYDEDTQTYTYAKPKRLAGAINLNLSPAGNTQNIFADNGTWFTAVSNQGYTGTIELAYIPDEFRKDVLREIEDKDGFVYEVSDNMPEEFALLFQFEGDVKNRRHVMYRCKVERPNIESETNNENISVQTGTLNITVTPREGDHKVKGYLQTGDAGYDTFFNEVYEVSAVDPILP